MNRLGLVAGVLVSAVAACGGGSDDSPPDSCGLRSLSGSDCPEGTGTVELHFAAADEVTQSSFLVDPLKGTVHGDLFRPEHVGGAGPTSDAVSIHAVRVDGVDLTASTGPSVQSFTASVCAGKYQFLGFLDVDANAGTPALADRGDPVTTPSGSKAQQFEVKANLHTKQTITLDMTLVCTVTCLNPPICVL